MISHTVMREDRGYVNPRQYGSTLDHTTLQAALTAIGSTPASLLLTPGTWSIGANLTIPAHVTLSRARGAILAVSSGVTVTINGDQEGPLCQWIALTGTGRVAFLAVAPVYAEWWGAKRDGTSNDTAALQAAIDSHVISTPRRGATLHLLPGVYKISTLTLRASTQIHGCGRNWPVDGTTYVKGTGGTPMLIFQQATDYYANFIVLADLTLGEGSDGLYLSGTGAPGEGTPTLLTIERVQFSCTHAAVWFDDFHMEEFYMTNCQLYGGEYGVLIDNTTAGRYLDKTTFINVLAGGNTKNAFCLKTPLVDSVTWLNCIINTSGEHGVVLDGGIVQAMFINVNCEGPGMNGKSNRTTGTIAAGSNALTVASATGFAVNDQVTIAGAGASGRHLVATITAIAGVVFTLSTTATVAVTSAYTTNAIYDTFYFGNTRATPGSIVFLGGSIGGDSDLGHTRYCVNAGTGAGGLGSVAKVTLVGSVCYDMDNHPVYDPDGRVSVIGGQLRVHQQTLNVAGDLYAANVFGEYKETRTLLGSPYGKDLVLALRDSLGTGGGTRGNFEVRNSDPNRTRLMGMSGEGDVNSHTVGALYTYGKIAPGSFGGMGFPCGISFASAAPTTGTWIRGDLIFHNLPAVGQPKGWVCVTAGSPGVWVSLGNL